MKLSRCAAGLVWALAACLGPVNKSITSVSLENLPGPSTLAVDGASPSFVDDGDLSSLKEALTESLRFYRSLPPDRTFPFGKDVFTARELIDGYEALLSADLSPSEFSKKIKKDFVLYSSPGVGVDHSVTFSAYYEHELVGDLTASQRFRYPLYGRPGDLKEVRGNDGVTRVYRMSGGRGKDYFTREEIDSQGALKGRGLEIAWAEDPTEIFFLQVQGSGWLRLPDGRRLRLRYAGNNGLPYRSVGGHMIDKGAISREMFSRKTMVEYLASHPAERQTWLNYNPRYVFFKIDRGPSQDKAFGSLRVPLTPRRSVATDPVCFPLGALGWMETDGPIHARRFIVNQDEGGAIKGPGRVDYFTGGGSEAEELAVRFWEKGRLYWLAPRGGMRLGRP